MIKLISYIITLLFFVSAVSAQQKKIYVFKDRYPKEIRNVIDKESSYFAEIKIMTGNMLLSGKNNIDYRKIENYLNELYPSKNAIGVLCIDLEHAGYNYLKGNNITRFRKASINQFQNAEEEFIEIIRFIKNKRPQLQVGVYGMPFKIYSESEKRIGSEKSLDKILKEADILMPSFYMPYPAEYNGLDKNLKYLEINLKQVLESGKRLDKPVLPFFWYFVFSPDKKFTYELIPKDEMKMYTDYILNYNLKSKEVLGLIWWDTATPFYKKNRGMIKQNYIKQNYRKKEVNRTDLFFYYFR